MAPNCILILGKEKFVIKRKYILISVAILIIISTAVFILASKPKFCLENISLGRSLNKEKIPNTAEQNAMAKLFIEFEEFKQSPLIAPKFVVWNDIKNKLFYVVDQTYPIVYAWYGPFSGEPYKVLRCSISYSFPFLNKLKKEETFTETCLKEKEPDLICTQLLVGKGLMPPSVCNTIETEKERGACYYNGAIKADDILVCDKISDIEWQSTCKTVLKKNPELCKNLMSKGILGDYYVNLCYEDLAKINNDLSLCDHFRGNNYKYVDCYQGVATYLNSTSVCEKLESKGLVTQCKSQFNNLKKSY